MVYIFTLVKAAVGKARDVFSKLKATDGIERVHAVFGNWDIVCISKSDDLNVAAKTVLDTIHNIDGITKTSTLIEAEI